MTNYPVEVLDDEEDDGTMVNSLQALTDAVVGHRIVSAGRETKETRWGGTESVFCITLDNGKIVEVEGLGDCCAYTELESFLLNVDKIDHIITGVGTTDGFTTWHVFADFGDIMEMKVGWSCGNPFYYTYGFDIRVRDND